jgi:hypothetical protein
MKKQGGKCKRQRAKTEQTSPFLLSGPGQVACCFLLICRFCFALSRFFPTFALNN